MGLPLASPVCRRLLEVDRATPERRGSSGARHVIRWAFGRPKPALAALEISAQLLSGLAPVRNNRPRGSMPAVDKVWGRGPVLCPRPALIIFSNAIHAPRRRRGGRGAGFPVRPTLSHLPGGVTYILSPRRHRVQPAVLVPIASVPP